jgi:hypothetical protein
MCIDVLPWAALLALGAVHGINPGMGWLFAVARGLQERTARAVWGTLIPLALGHALAIGVVVALAALVGALIPGEILRWAVAATLIGFGTYRLLRGRHPRYGGMRMGARDLTIWSFLMASAHGAGLMVLPFVLPEDGGVATLHAHAAVTSSAIATASPAPLTGAAVTLLHTGSYLLVTAAIALLVYEVVGLHLLRSAWINLDRIWGVALILTGALTPLL